jgi:hypothetical protein
MAWVVPLELRSPALGGSVRDPLLASLSSYRQLVPVRVRGSFGIIIDRGYR